MHALVCFIGEKAQNGAKNVWSLFSQEALLYMFILNECVVSINMQSQNRFTVVNATFLFLSWYICCAVRKVCIYYFFLKFFFFSFLFNFIACADLFKRSRIPKFFFFFLPFSLTVHFTQSSSNPLLRLYNLASRLLFDHPSTLVSILGTFCDPLLQSCLWSTREFWTRLFCIAPALLVSARIFFFFWS